MYELYLKTEKLSRFSGYAIIQLPDYMFSFLKFLKRRHPNLSKTKTSDIKFVRSHEERSLSQRMDDVESTLKEILGKFHKIEHFCNK